MSNSLDAQIQQAKSHIEGANSILIAIGSNPPFDSIASALSFFLGLSSLGKQVSIISPTPMTVGFSHLVGVDKISNSLNGTNGKNLVISFPYQEGSIEKVSYNIEGNAFNLVIEPRDGHPTITKESINFSKGGGNIDLVITVGVANLSNLENIGKQNQELFQNKTVINIDINSANSNFGKINLIDPNLSSISEYAVSLFSKLGLQMNTDIATNLLAGINKGSNNFTSPNTTAATFEAAALCLRSNAKKSTVTPSPLNQSGKSQAFIPPQVIPPQVIPPQVQTPKTIPSQSLPLNTQKPNNSIKVQPTQPANTGIKTDTNQQKPSQQVPKPPQTQSKQQSETPPDWLKPKIFKGSTLL